MAKRLAQPGALGPILGALGRFASQQAVHSVVDKFAGGIVRNPEIRAHLAQTMYEREQDMRPWAELKAAEREVWLRRVDCVVREISTMTQPKLGK